MVLDNGIHPRERERERERERGERERERERERKEKERERKRETEREREREEEREIMRICRPYTQVTRGPSHTEPITIVPEPMDRISSRSY